MISASGFASRPAYRFHICNTALVNVGCKAPLVYSGYQILNYKENNNMKREAYGLLTRFKALLTKFLFSRLNFET